MKKFSVDELLKERPGVIGDLKCCPVEGRKYSVIVNGVCVFANKYEVVYGNNVVHLRFYNYKGDHVASMSAHGSNEVKGDECFYLVNDNNIVSESDYRVMADWISD